MAESVFSVRRMAAILLIAGVVAAVPGAIYWYMLAMPGRSFSGPLPPLTADERALAATLRGHVEAVASRPHNAAHPAELEASARYIEGRLAGFGHAPRTQRYIAGALEVRNIEAVIEPAGGRPSTVASVVIGAHYDSFGEAPGANDNGSGTAVLLALAERLGRHRPAATRLRLVFFVNEEPPHFRTGTMGSLRYAKALAHTGERVRGMIALDCLGAYYDAPGSQRYRLPLGPGLPSVGNFVAVVGRLGVRPFAAEVIGRFRETTAFPSVGGVAPGGLAGISWSDHWSFGEVGIPAIMITDTALFRYPHYHLPSDTPDKLDYERLARVAAGLERVIKALAP